MSSMLTFTSFALLALLCVIGVQGNIILYDDYVHSPPFGDWSWASVRNPNTTTYVHSGNYSYSFVPSDYAGLFFACDQCINTTRHSAIQLYVYLGANATQQVVNLNLVQILNSQTTIIYPVIAVLPISSSNISNANNTFDTWYQVNITLSQFPQGLYDGFQLQGGVAGTQDIVYFDDISVLSFNPNQTEFIGTLTGFSASASATTTYSSASSTSTTGGNVTTSSSTSTTSTSASTSTSTSTSASTSSSTSTTSISTATTSSTTGPTAQPTAAPSAAPTSVPWYSDEDYVALIAYDDKVESPFEDYSWASSRLANDDVHFSGNFSYSFAPSDYQAMYLYCAACISTFDYDVIEFWINGGWQGNQSLNFNLMGANATSTSVLVSSKPITTYTGGIPLQVNKWIRGVVHLSDFEPGFYSGFQFQGETSAVQQTVYVDSIFILKVIQQSTTGGSAASPSTTNNGASTDSSDFSGASSLYFPALASLLTLYFLLLC